MRFGEKVHALHTGKGLSLWILGRRLGVSHASISKVENGKFAFGDHPSKDLIRRLAAALDDRQLDQLPTHLNDDR
jgi:transcriptional regulator with XRE-family HTH domain